MKARVFFRKQRRRVGGWVKQRAMRLNPHLVGRLLNSKRGTHVVHVVRFDPESCKEHKRYSEMTRRQAAQQLAVQHAALSWTLEKVEAFPAVPKEDVRRAARST